MDLAKVLERRADRALLLEDETILYLEHRSTNESIRCRVRPVGQEVRTMGATSNMAKNEILSDWIRDGQEIIIRGQVEMKFGKLPKWACPPS